MMIGFVIGTTVTLFIVAICAAGSRGDNH